MRILVTGHSVNHYRQQRMWEWIAEQEHDVLLCGPRQWNDEKYDVVKKKHFMRVPLGLTSFKGIFHYRMPQLLEMIETFKPDALVCFEEPPSLFAFECMSYAKLFRVPWAVFTWENIPKVYNAFYRSIEREVLNEADLAIAGNSEAGRLLQIKGVTEGIVLPQSGLDPELFRPLPAANKKRKRILYVGRLVPEKDIQGILIAYDQVVKKEIENVELMFVGGRGNELEKIKKHPDYGKTVLWEPWKSYESLPEVYATADVIVYTSLDTPFWIEQWGAVCGEALLCEKQVVANIAGALPEYWKCDDTIFVAQGDRDMLGWAIVKALENPKVAKAGREHVKKNWSIEVVGAKYLKALEKII